MKRTFVGLTEKASRVFEAPALRLAGAGFIHVVVAVFDTNDHADAAFPSMVEFYRDYLYRDQTEVITETLRAASAPKLGDEAVAYTGRLPNPNDPVSPFFVGIFGWRENAIIYESFAMSSVTDPLVDLFAVGRAITGRELNDDPVSVPVSPLEMRTGGVWDLLPTLTDVPEGLVFTKDEE